MKLNKLQFKLILAGILSFFIFEKIKSITPTDLPNFYRAPHNLGYYDKPIKNGGTEINLQLDTGSAHSGYSKKEEMTNVLNIYGNIDVNKLAYNLENLTSANKPKTYHYLRKAGNPSTIIDNGIIPNFFFGDDNGKIELRGKFNITELEATIQQNLFYGFYAKAYLPLRTAKINNICVVNLTSTTTTDYNNFKNFLDNELNNVLQENCLKELTCPFNKTALCDMNLCFGWNGIGKNLSTLIKELSGSAEIGIVIPTAGKMPQDQVVTMPMGYNTFCINARLHIDAKPLDWVHLGVHGDSVVFFEYKENRRMKTSHDQSGLIMLEKGFTKVMPGPIWQVGIYAQAIAPSSTLKGLFALLGYSFTRQEDVVLRMRPDDTTFLKTYLEDQQTAVYKDTRDYIVNSDERLKSWHHHTIHVQVGFDGKEWRNKKIFPKITLFSDIIIFGKRTFAADIFGGNATLAMEWNF